MISPLVPAAPLPRAAGLYASQHELLLTCPLCGTPKFTERGLRAHHCRATPERRRLTPGELQLARTRSLSSTP